MIAVHDHYLESFITNSSDNENMNKDRFLVAVNKNGYLVPIVLRVKAY